jgi:broad specificity phosphatase PhoE
VTARIDPPPCRVLLVRHASAEGQGSFLGQRDAPLSAIGRRQLPALVQKLRGHAIDVVYCSDLSRARATAEAVAKPRRAALEVRRALREMDFGRWEGLSWEQVAEQYPWIARRWMTGRVRPRVPGGEPFSQFTTRTTRALAEIVAAHPGRGVAIVTHAGVIRVAIGAALGIDERHLFRVAQPPCAVNVIDYFRGGVIVESINA